MSTTATVATMNFVDSVADQSGAVHILGEDNSIPGTFRAIDGSGYTWSGGASGRSVYTDNSPHLFFEPDGVLATADGLRYAFSYHQGDVGIPVSLTDMAGNAMSFTVQTPYDFSTPQGNVLTNPVLLSPPITDSIGRSIPAPASITQGNASGCPNLGITNQPAISSIVWSVPGPNGANVSYLICEAKISLNTAFYGSLLGPIGVNQTNLYDDATGVVNVIQSIVLPDNSYWGFIYDSAGNNPVAGGSGYNYHGMDPTKNPIAYGDLLEVRLPTGGRIDYTYTTIFNNSDSTSASYERFVHTRTVSDNNGGVNQWTYAYSRNSSQCATTVTDPAGNQTQHVYNWNIYTGDCDSDEQQTIQYSGLVSANQPLRTISRTYIHMADPQSAPVNPYPDGTYLLHTLTTHDGGTSASTTTTYSYQQLFTDIQPEYSISTAGSFPDYYPNSPGTTNSSPVTIYYGSPTGSIVTDSANNVLSQTSDPFEWMSSNPYYVSNLLTLPASHQIFIPGTQTIAAATSFGYDEASIAGSACSICGYQTSQSAYLNTANTYVKTSKSSFNKMGAVSSHTDGNGNTTYYTYDSTGIFPISVQHPSTAGINHIDYYSFDNVTGGVVWHTDQNGTAANDSNHTTQYSYDRMGRVTDVLYPPTQSGRPETQYCYTDIGGATCSATSAPPYGAYATIIATPDPNIITSTQFDGFGRAAYVVYPNGTSSSTSYNYLGLVGTNTQPYGSSSSPSVLTRTFNYDALGRATSESYSDGNSLQWCYNGFASAGQTNCNANQNSTLATSWIDLSDEAGHVWQKGTDLLGRLVDVFEPAANSSVAKTETDYVYDNLDDLTTVTQKGLSTETARVRSFTYDSLGRILTASNPESGLTCYGLWNNSSCTNGYDGNGNLLAKTDGAGNVTSYSYDGLNRVLSRSFSDATNISCYQYDSSPFVATSANLVGHVSNEWTVANGNGPCASANSSGIQTRISFLGYDAIGRPESQTTVAPNATGSMSAVYDVAGQQISLTYPDGRVIKDSYDAAGRMSGVQYASWNGTTVNQTFLTVTAGGGYDAANHLTAATVNGSLPFISSGYDGRGRVTKLSYGTSSAPIWSKQYAWAGNSNLISQTDLITGIQRQFGYDNLNRLTAAQDIYSNLAIPSGSNDETTSTSTSGSGAEETPGVTGASPEWTDPDESNLLGEPGAPNSGWIATNATISPSGFYLAPDGTLSARLVTATGTANIQGTVATPAAYSLETMSGSVWLRSVTGNTQTINLYLMGNGVARGMKSITFGPTWQQFQVTAAMTDETATTTNDLTSLAFEIGGGGTLVSGQSFLMWNPMLEDQGSAGTSTTNFLPYSQLVTGSSWSELASAVVANTGMAPDGSQTAATVTAAAVNTGSNVTDTVANPAPADLQPIVGSVYLTSATSLSLVVSVMETVGSTTSLCGQYPVTLGPVWQRVSVNCTAQNALSQLYLQIGGGSFVNGARFQIWGAQIEFGSQAGPYVPTAAVPMTVGTTLTNLLAYSQEPTASSWAGVVGYSVSSTPVAAPDASMTASKITATSSSISITDSSPNAQLYGGSTVTGSVYLKSESGAQSPNFYLFWITAAGTQYSSPLPVALSTTWQRFQITTTLPLGVTGLGIQIGSSASFTTGQIVDLWGAQMEIASKAGPYVATTAIPVIAGSEPTNILPNSQSLSGANWTPFSTPANATTVTPNYALAPDGTMTASLLQASSTSNDTGINASVPNPSLYDQETVTASVYLRSATSSNQNVNLYLQNSGATGTAAATQLAAVATPNWQRFDLTKTLENGNTHIYLQIGGAGSLKLGQSVEIWGAQFVIGSSPDPYTSTSGTTTIYATGQPGTLVPTGLNQTYSYDSFGNLQQNGSFSSSYTSKNQLFGYAYNAAGDLQSDGMNVMTWDAANRLSTVGGASYIYDAEDRRVEKQASTVVDTISFGGLPIARISAGQWTDLVYGPTGLLAEVPGTSSGTPIYRLTDNLGSNVGSLLASGTFVDSVDHTPFGQIFTGSTSDPYLFASQERDPESQFDYFGARNYSNVLGRFMSYDPKGNSVANFSNPQTWNMYSYASNNPLLFVDTTGTETALYQSGSCFTYTYDEFHGREGTYQVYNYTIQYGDCSDEGQRTTPNVQIATAELRDIIGGEIDKGNLNQCQGLANYVDAAQQISGASGPSEAMALITPNTHPIMEAMLGIGSETNTPGFGETGGESGFRPIYQNSTPDVPGWNGDQTHHFAAYFQAGYAHPVASLKSPVPLAFEAYQTVFEGTPMNWGDVALGYAAQIMGQMSGAGILPNSSIGSAIRSNICQKP